MEREIIYYNQPELGININQIYSRENNLLREIHFHNAIELVIVNSGECSCYVDGREITLMNGEMILINSRVFHRLQLPKERSEVEYIQIDLSPYISGGADESERLLAAFVDDKSVLQYKTFGLTNELYHSFFNMKKELETKNEGYENYIRAHIYFILAVMSRHGMLLKSFEMARNPKTARLIPLVSYIQENISCEISLDSAAASVNLDKYYFCKYFKKSTGRTFTDLLNFLRINRAEQLLVSTDKTVLEISLDCGFSSPQYFNRLFKRKNNCSPKEFRNFARKVNYEY